MKTWVKLYTEINRDPKMAQFTWAQKGIWAALLALAGDLDIRNGDGAETGQLQSVADTAWSIRCEPDQFREAVSALLAGEHPLLHETEGVLFITNYAKRQARPPSTRPAASRERKRRQRARESQARHEASQPLTPSESESETDTDTESDQSQTQNVTGREGLPPSVLGFKRVPDLISSLSPSDSDLTLTDAARIERAIEIRERAEHRKLPGREEAQMRQWANEYGPAILYEATRRTAHNKPDNFGGYLRKTLGQIGKPREPP